MNETSRHDAWEVGDGYDAYMGRWSRQIAAKFLDWLDMEEKLDWLEVGCGTGALSESILSKCNPESKIDIKKLNLIMYELMRQKKKITGTMIRLSTVIICKVFINHLFQGKLGFYKYC